tara:strand:- start:5146 stop:5355 length:210 start_codon:yes stop_codon:yes gene_type:complete
VFSKINSHNEWDKLKEIIVGTSIGTMATLTWKNKNEPSEEVLTKAYELAQKACPKCLTNKREKDLVLIK